LRDSRSGWILHGATAFATGQTDRLEDFINAAYSHVGLAWREHVITSEELFRPKDLGGGRGDHSKVKNLLGWEAFYMRLDVVRMMMGNELDCVAGRCS
jgi:GDPmannose 4,6-dehydratase